MENQILELFLYHNNLKFNKIEKLLKIRSNKLSYYLKILIKKGILTKNKENYSLSESSEFLIPYISNKKAVLPVLLIHLGNKSSCFLYKREKKPFKDMLSLPGGRFLVNESIKQASKRIMLEKFKINVNFKKINSISLEHVKKQNKIIHSFLLIFVSVRTKDKTPLTKINKKVIPSDYKLLKNNLNSSIKINHLTTFIR